MRKKWLLLLIVIMAVVAVIGCEMKESNPDNSSEDGTSQEESQENILYLKDIKVEDYVTIGTYKGMEIVVAPKGEVDVEEWDTLVEEAYFGSVTADNGGIVDRAVEDGDTVYIDYVGKEDGVPFDRGSDVNFPLTIGSGSFIDGFEEGLIGVMPGETVDLNLRFPEGYKNNPALAGQEVVFTVTVHYIMPTEMKDEVVAAWGDPEYSNLEEFRQFAYEYLEESILYEYEMNVENAIMDQFMSNCVFKGLPEGLLAQVEENMRLNIQNTAAMYGMDADSFISYSYNTTLEGFISMYVEDAVKQRLAFKAVANLENLNISDEELDKVLLEYAINAGYASAEEYANYEQRENYRDSLMFDKVLTFLVEVSSIVES